MKNPWSNAQSTGERERARTCQTRHRDRWAVVQRHGNASAFNGYRWQPSAYSCIRCLACDRTWRTKAAYVETLPGLTPRLVMTDRLAEAIAAEVVERYGPTAAGLAEAQRVLIRTKYLGPRETVDA